jgi:hypothetical protein
MEEARNSKRDGEWWNKRQHMRERQVQ